MRDKGNPAAPPYRTSPARSALMKRVRQRGTSAEITTRKALFSVGGRFRANVRDLPGRPDIANKGRRRAIFVHGCFWHHHRPCGRGRIPSGNRDFWIAKLSANVSRDRRKLALLRRAGYRVLVIWECELSDDASLRARLRNFWFYAQS